MNDLEAWQAEADLLAEGRDRLEALCSTTRYGHLFPGGPNMALLFRAYQDVDRWRTVTRRDPERPRTRRMVRRRLRRRLKRLVREDALARDRRLIWGYPEPRPVTMHVDPPDVVRQALSEVDPDARRDVAAKIHGRPIELPADAGESLAGKTIVAGQTARVGDRAKRGLEQFRDAMVNAALAHPKSIGRLHPQYLQFMASAPPTRRRHPLATLFLVKLPLQLLMILILIFNVAYLSAYYFLNDERLGDLITTRVSAMIDGDLVIESLHWTPMLIVDLLTGRPHTVEARGLAVYSPHKADGVAERDKTAYAEHLQADLVLHEIIPWNRAGVPKLVEIPWVLHFTELRNRGELWVDVRAYRDEHRGGEWLISLVDAFDTIVELDPPPDLKKLSYRIDHADLDGVTVTLDMEEKSGWATQLTFDDIEASLDFENWAPQDGRPEVLPLAWSVDVREGGGTFTVAPIHDGPMAMDSISRLELASGINFHPLGDLWIAGEAELAGSPSVFEGRLLDVFGDLGVDFRLGTTDLGPLGYELFPAKPDDSGNMRSLLHADGSPASLEIKGPIDEVVLEAVGQGLTLDLFPESAWAVDDVDVSLSLAQDPLPELWADLEDHPALIAAAARRLAEESGEPVAPDDHEHERWIVYLDTFRGSAFDGDVRLHRRGGQDHVVLPREGEPMLVSIYLDLFGVNLGQLTPDNRDVADMLTGETRGGLQIHQVVLDEGLQRAEAELHRLSITRDRGPADDNLPRRLMADGEIIWDAAEGLDLRGVRIGVDGGQLRISGGVDAEFSQLDPTTASLRVDDGPAFMAAFGQPAFFDELSTDFSVYGPVRDPRGVGTLDVFGASAGSVAIDEIKAATLRLDRGTLSVRSKNVAMLGGHGPLEADLGLLANGKVLSDPRIRLALTLEDINRANILGSGIGAGGATIALKIDDGADKPVRLSQLQARGSAYADTLEIADVEYRDAEASFAFTRDGIEIDHLNLAYHRPLSPANSPEVTVPVGRVQAAGKVGFSDDPSLDLEVEASNMPLSAIAASAGIPLRGQISRGSHLSVTGTLRRPEVDGQLVLRRIGAAGIPLGGGTLEFSSVDVPHVSADPERQRAATAAHRQVRITGTLTGPRNATTGEGELDWGVDATVAFGGGNREIEAAVDLRFDTLPLDSLLAHPSRSRWRTHVVGGLHDLLVEARYCPSHADGRTPFLAQCAQLDPNDPRQLAGEPVRIDLSLAQLWYRGVRDGEAVATAVDPCLNHDTTCSLNPLRARLDGTTLSLADPWRIQSGGKGGSILTVEGTFDLSSDDDDARAEAHSAKRRCVPGVPDNASLPPGDTAAAISGGLDFAAISPLLAPWGVASPEGRLDLDLGLTGIVSRPTITGYIRLPADAPLNLSLEDDSDPKRRRKSVIPIQVPSLELAMAGGTLYLDNAAIKVFDETLRLGAIGNRSTYIDLAGPCSGRFAVQAAGAIDGAVIRRLLPGLVEASSGAVEVREFRAMGDLARLGGGDDDDGDDEPGNPRPTLDGLAGTLSFERKSIGMSVTNIGDVRLASGLVEIRQCTRARPCRSLAEDGTTERRTRGIGIWLGGQRTARSQSKPANAVGLRVGDRGRASLWGEVILDDRFTGLDDAHLLASASMFPISLSDNYGRPELEAALSSDRISFVTDGARGRVSGRVLIERSFWLRDARQGVAVLSFTDTGAAPPSQLPEYIRNLDLDLELETGAPFRVDNNVAKKLEASASLRLGGTIGDPALSGTIDVESGVVDVDILGGAYDVQGGKVVLGETIGGSELDIHAVRQKPIKVNNQLLTLNLRLLGTLDAIQWECFAPGDTSGALATTRGCVDYLIFDAGNTDLAESEVRDNRNNTNLLGSTFLPLAGRLTQVELNEVLEREIPRVESYLPYVRFRVDQLGVLIEAETRPEWLRWGWGRLGLNFTYLRGYPGGYIRDSRSVSGILEILENTAFEATFGSRNYSNRVLILDPPNYQSIQFIQRLELPSAR